MSDLKRVRSGEPLLIKAGTWNAFIDAAEDFRNRSRGIAATTTGSTPAGILVQNISDADVARFGVLALTEPIISSADNLGEFQDRVAMQARAPEAGDAGRWAVLAEPIKAGECGIATVAGLCQVQVEVTDASHQYAEMAVGQTDHLVSASSGSARIISKSAATGVVWCVVRLQPSTPTVPAGCWARIGSSTAADTPARNRWLYAWVEVEKTSAGYAGWTTKTGGASGTTSSNSAYNSIEDANAATGVLGNGVNASTLNTVDWTFTVKACPSGTVVWLTPVVLTGGSTEYWFAYENGVDGSCDF